MEEATLMFSRLVALDALSDAPRWPILGRLWIDRRRCQDPVVRWGDGLDRYNFCQIFMHRILAGESVENTVSRHVETIETWLRKGTRQRINFTSGPVLTLGGLEQFPENDTLFVLQEPRWMDHSPPAVGTELTLGRVVP
jgi:hypothetical protein